MSACDVKEANSWHFQLSLDDNTNTNPFFLGGDAGAAASQGPTEVFWELRATLEDSTRSLGDAPIDGFACCGQYKYYAFESVHERTAPLVNFNLTSGRIKALYWRYNSCPREEEHVYDGNCLGWCVLDWYRLYSENLGLSRYRQSSTLRVPYGWGDEPDKRRGGTWYLGIQALDEPAEYHLTTATQQPAGESTTCGRMDFFCSEWPDRDKTMEGEGEWSWSAASSNQQPAARRAALIFAAAASALLLYLSK